MVDLCLLCECSYKMCQGSHNSTNKRRWKKSCLACSGKSSTSSVDAPSHRCLVRSFKRLLKFTISGALLLNKDYGVLRSTVYYFIKCFSGEGDLEVKLLALCGKVTTFDNFGAYLFHLPTPPRPRTCRGAAAGKLGPDRVQHCCGAASSPSPSLPSLPLPLSLSFLPLNKTDLN